MSRLVCYRASNYLSWLKKADPCQVCVTRLSQDYHPVCNVSGVEWLWRHSMKSETFRISCLISVVKLQRYSWSNLEHKVSESSLLSWSDNYCRAKNPGSLWLCKYAGIVRCFKGAFFWDYSRMWTHGREARGVLGGDIPIPEWTEYYSGHSAPEGAMNRIILKTVYSEERNKSKSVLFAKYMSPRYSFVSWPP